VPIWFSPPVNTILVTVKKRLETDSTSIHDACHDQNTKKNYKGTSIILEE
jgi:hypothetical protein